MASTDAKLHPNVSNIDISDGISIVFAPNFVPFLSTLTHRHVSSSLNWCSKQQQQQNYSQVNNYSETNNNNNNNKTNCTKNEYEQH